MAHKPEARGGNEDPYAYRRPTEPRQGAEAHGEHTAPTPVGWGAPSSWTTPDTYQPREQHRPEPSPQHPAEGAPSPAGPPRAEGIAPPPAGPARRQGRGPGWGAMVGSVAATALLASTLTAGLTGAWDDDATQPDATQQDAAEQQAGGTASAGTADPVVSSTSQNPDWEAVADAVRPTVVAISVATGSGGGVGSGVILDEDGHILTNEHVVAGGEAGQIVVTLADGSLHEATVVGTDIATDLAVIRITDPPERLVPATLGDSEEVAVGHAVVAVGNPLGLSSTVTTGIVSALDRPVTTVRQSDELGQQATQVTTNAIQVDAAINPGNSGGPLFDSTGRVIGITSSIATLSGSGGASGSIGLGFAIPVNLAETVAGQLIEDGTAEHAFLGVAMTDATATADGVVRSGAEVRSVEPGSAAAEAGLQEGDVITFVDGEPVVSATSLTGWIRQHTTGDTVEITAVRDGEVIRTEATLTTRADEVG
ncbi:trypsin-like peptidase domain-containing protein [Georgenia sp. 10Sc9-8]|uniref:Trypsin-like peptidase domain-containing protein n=1 Tax=Georgenia halotolerans TaxID=3028317 RepID=A0ABT5U3B0_9MICO|nr:trypsin-like peptidase domain-containing protein [Georgenia halotolerans]